jgi:hypothetical protein
MVAVLKYGTNPRGFDRLPMAAVLKYRTNPRRAGRQRLASSLHGSSRLVKG